VIKLLLYPTFAIILICSAGITQAQLIDNSSTFRNIHQKKYFRFHYDNDYFTKTDEYYSQGITLEYVHPFIKKIPAARLLWKPFNTQPQYGVSFNLFGYTPTTILSDSILYATGLLMPIFL
jgi:lipid A 3-O-deacylase